MARAAIIIGGLAFALGATVLPAFAQMPVSGGRPNPALFGGATREAAHRVTFDSQLAGGIARVTTDLDGPADGAAYGFGVGTAGLNYASDWRRAGLYASASSSAHYFPAFSDSLITTRHLLTGGRGNVPLGRRTSLLLDGHLTYRPLTVGALFPGMFERPDLFSGNVARLPTEYDFGVSDQHYMTADASVTVSHALSSRSSLAGGYEIQRAYGGSFGRELTTQRVFGRYTRSLARGLSMRLGYGRRFVDYDIDGERRHLMQHDIDAGLDYNRSLSFSRRTTLSFSSGTRVTSYDEYAPFNAENRVRFDVVGGALLRHEIGRTWSAGLDYRREVQFVGVLGEPTLSDGVSASIVGLSGRRVSFSAAAGAASGRVGFDRDSASGFVAYHGSAGVHTALNAYLAANVDYVYYRYRFDRGEVLPSGLGGAVSRHVAMASLDLTLPVFHRGRLTNAAR